jgi:hypothetical protein
VKQGVETVIDDLTRRPQRIAGLGKLDLGLNHPGVAFEKADWPLGIESERAEVEGEAPDKLVIVNKMDIEANGVTLG